MQGRSTARAAKPGGTPVRDGMLRPYARLEGEPGSRRNFITLAG